MAECRGGKLCWTLKMKLWEVRPIVRERSPELITTPGFAIPYSFGMIFGERKPESERKLMLSSIEDGLDLLW
jgi:hypothetical protein